MASTIFLRFRAFLLALALCTVLTPAAGFAQNIGQIEIKGVSPRDVSADTSGVFDQVSSGLNAVAVGEKVYLEALPVPGGQIGGAVWELTGTPTGSSAELSDSEGTLVTLVPDVAGLYLVTMTPLDGEMEEGAPVVQRIYAGVWVGAGVFNTHESPDSGIPSCANSCCHESSDQPRLNVVPSWLETKHANKLQAHLGGEYGSTYGQECLSCHTLGFREGAENRGFDDIAAALGYDLDELTALVAEAGETGTDNWPLLPAELQRHASVQCESCHGPGSQHLGFILDDDRGIAGVDLGTKQCAQCHDTDVGDYGIRFAQWERSPHTGTHQSSGTVAGNNTCRACHTGEGFVHAVAKGEPIPQMANADYHPATCSTCHAPHGSEHPNDLRVSGSTALPSGDVYANAGKGGLCMNCHNSRSSNAEETALGSFRGAHYGPQGEMLLGTGMATFGLPVVGNSAHTTIVKDTCVACHAAESGSEYVGGHTFAMRYSPNPSDPSQDIINAEAACASCHSTLTDTYDYASRGDYDGDGQRKGVQSEVKGLLALLRPGLLELPGTSLGSDGTISTSAGSFGGYSDDQKRALYNYNLVVKDGSYGVHNTSFAVQALQRSYYGVYGRPITDDYPNIDLRGPVQPTQVVPPTPTPTPIPSPTPAPPDQEFLAEIALRSVSHRDAALNETGLFAETASGLRAIGVGEIVYMDAVRKDDAVIGYTWSILSRPTGSVAALSDTTGEMVTFRPDVRGTYLIRLTPQTAGKEVIGVHDQRIYAGEWVGAGVFGDSTPRAPQCGTGFCHGDNTGDPRLNVLADWQKSSHAQKLQSHLNGDQSAFYRTSCLPCHTVGFNERVSADNNGFDDIAAHLGYDLNQIADLVADAANNNRENFDLLPADLRNHASVQCESCHGAGSQHPANLSRSDKGIDGANLGTAQCAQCHDAANGRYQGHYQWNNSAHALTNQTTGSVAGNNTCRACHTGEGFVAVHAKQTDIPQLRNEDYHATTCSTCHDPHYSDHPGQLRVAGDYAIPSGERPFASGSGGLCFRCHNSRVADGETTAISSFRGAHSSTQADMLLGSTGASFGLEFAANSAHAVVVPDSCVHCHMADGVGESGDLTPPLVGEHTFKMTDHGADGVHNAVNACATCHSGLDTYDLRATGDYDGNGIVEGVQTEVSGLLDILREGILETMPGTSASAAGSISIGAGDFASLSDDQKRAIYNFNFVSNDGSLGIHNTAYAVQLLQRSYHGVYGRPITEDYPNMALRGPVQEITSAESILWMLR